MHPATVHFPLTFLSAAYTLDTVNGLAQRYRALAVLAPYLADVSRFSYVCHIAGLLTSIPSFTSGTAEYNVLLAGGVDYGYLPAANLGQRDKLGALGYRIEPWNGWAITYAPYNFANPAILFNNDLGFLDTFGLSSATPDVAGANPVIGTGGPRNIQFGLKVRF